MAGRDNEYEKEILAKTVYAEARGEPDVGKEAVAWVIKNRASKNRSYWGGSKISDVCLKKGQFECWNGNSDIDVSKESQTYKEIRKLTDRIYSQPGRNDPTGGADHYNNPEKEGYPDWTRNVKKTKKIENHQFYKGD